MQSVSTPQPGARGSRRGSSLAGFCLAVACLAASAVQAQTPERFLSGPGVDLSRVLPAPPVRGSPADQADRDAFASTRSLVGSSRWTLATADADESVPYMLQSFSQAAGRPLSLANTPRLAALLVRMRPDLAAAATPAKDHFQRKRPFLVDDGPICQPRGVLEGSYDYPSGHTTWGTAVALVLAELIPDRASPILARGREYGESRIVCGAHNASAVAAGRFAAAAVVARLHGQATFRAALDAARDELAP